MAQTILGLSSWLARAAFAGCVLAPGVPALAQDIAPVGSPPAGVQPLPSSVSGRVQAQADGTLVRQWPGTYFETAFVGADAYFRVGPGDVSLRVSVDGGVPVPLVKPSPGLYRIGGLDPRAEHRLRMDVASESQDGPTAFGRFLAGNGARPAPLRQRARQIEFIGDSHTVGYGNTSTSRECTPDQVWATTDTSRGVAPDVARHYDADYRVNAISGRGVVRNHGGSGGDPVPAAYPYTLFDKSVTADDSTWHPQVIAISLGTNDFSTPLTAGEKWTTREQLHADYEATFVRFVKQLHQRQPQAYILLWASANDGSELQAELARVTDQVQRGGIDRIGFVPVSDLSLSGCNWHPSVADDRRVADALIHHLGAHDVLPGTPADSPTTTSAAPPAAAAPSRPAGKLADKLINDPKTVAWNVYGADQRNEMLAHGGPQDYPALRVSVTAKGANPWDAGASSALDRPVAAGDTVLVALYLRAPKLADGESTPVPYFGVNEGAPPYNIVAKGSANVTNQWKRYYAVGKAGQAFNADSITVGVHLAAARHVLDLGPVLVYDLGPNIDPFRLPTNK